MISWKHLAVFIVLDFFIVIILKHKESVLDLNCQTPSIPPLANYKLSWLCFPRLLRP